MDPHATELSPEGMRTPAPSGSTVRVVPATDPERYLAVDELVWFSEPVDLPPVTVLDSVPAEHRFAALLDTDDLDDPAGIYGVRPLAVSVPGPARDATQPTRRVRAAGLTWVGVHPDRRRRGVLTAMIRHHFDRCLADGVAVSLLHCSEVDIYGRYGYGIALIDHAVSINRGTVLRAPQLDDDAARVQTHTVTITDPEVPLRIRALHERLASTEPGTLLFAPEFYRAMTWQRPEQRRGIEVPRVLLARRDGEDVGLAVFQRRHKWSQGRPHGELEVQMLAGSPVARLALVRRLLDFDLMGTVRLSGIGEHDPLWYWLSGPRTTTEITPTDNVWARLIDLPAALGARGYAGDCDVVVDVRDTFLPDNSGAWRITIRHGEARVERHTAEDAAIAVRLDIAALGAIWLGGGSAGAGNLVAMHQAGLITEERPGSVRELWQAVRSDRALTPTIDF